MLQGMERLLQECTVKITNPDKNGWGTGFFVAPGFLLTCAHVVNNATEQTVNVYWPYTNATYPARILKAVHKPRTIDVALLKLDQTIPAHPCVYLDESIDVSEQDHKTNDSLFSYGYLKDYANAAGVTGHSEWYTGDIPPLIKFQGGEIQQGLSGGALLNLRTGKVIGIVKETRSKSFPHGGGAVPISTVYQELKDIFDLSNLQKAFHNANPRWQTQKSKLEIEKSNLISAQNIGILTKQNKNNSFPGTLIWISQKTNFLENLEPCYDYYIENIFTSKSNNHLDFTTLEFSVLVLVFTYCRLYLIRKTPMYSPKFKGFSHEDFFSSMRELSKSKDKIRNNPVKLSSLIKTQSMANLVTLLE